MCRRWVFVAPGDVNLACSRVQGWQEEMKMKGWMERCERQREGVLCLWADETWMVWGTGRGFKGHQAGLSGPGKIVRVQLKSSALERDWWKGLLSSISSLVFFLIFSSNSPKGHQRWASAVWRSGIYQGSGTSVLEMHACSFVCPHTQTAVWRCVFARPAAYSRAARIRLSKQSCPASSSLRSFFYACAFPLR